MPGNLTDVYSIVFNTLGEEKTVQSLIRIKKAADEVQQKMKDLTKSEGMNVFGKNYQKDMDNAYKKISSLISLHEKKHQTIQSMNDALRKMNETEQKGIKATTDMYTKMFISLEQTERKKLELAQKTASKKQELLQRERQATTDMYTLLFIQAEKLEQRKLQQQQKAEELKRQAAQKTVDEAMKNVQMQLDAEQKLAQQKLEIQQSYNAKVIQMNEWLRQAYTQRTVSQSNIGIQNQAMYANNAAAMQTIGNIQNLGQVYQQQMGLLDAKVKAAEADKKTNSELSKQLTTMKQIEKAAISVVKGFQRFSTSSFVFVRMFESITRTLDEWSKMSVAMSQFRSSANFESMNAQLDETVKKLGNVISKYEMIPAINKAKMLGMDFSGNKLSETLQMTTKVAQMFGMDATKAFGDFTVAISKASPIIMDNVGVLLRLEEAYKMFYDRQYKGKDSFDKWSESLTQAEKRTIYYKEAMRLLQEKTEGVSVKTNEVQSVLMRLKDAWFKMGTDLEEAGSLNPIIWALERIVGLAESVAATFKLISDGYNSMKFMMPSVFGDPDVGFKAKDVSGIFSNRTTAMQGVKSSYGEESLNAINQIYEQLRSATVAASNKYTKFVKSQAGMLITPEIRVEAAKLKEEWKQASVLLDEIEAKRNKASDVGFGVITDDDMQKLSKYIPDLKKYSEYLAGVNQLKKEQNQYAEKAVSSFMDNKFLDASLYGLATLWKKGRAESDEMAKQIGIHSTDPFIGSADISSEGIQAGQNAEKTRIEIEKRIANSQKLDEFQRSDYNTKKEALENAIKLYLEENKLTDNQIALAEKRKKTGAMFAISLNDIVVGDKGQLSGDKNYIRESALLKKEYNVKYQEEDVNSTKKMKELYGVREGDFANHLIAMKGLLGQQAEGVRGQVDVIRKVGEPLKQELWGWLTIGVKDESEIKKRAKEFEDIYAKYLDLVQAGAAIGLKNNIFSAFTKNMKKESSSGRQKAPKEFWDKWYEMNRSAFVDAMPEGITRDIEQARLDWFDQTKNLEMLEKDILKAKREGRLDPAERFKFFGKSGNEMGVFETQMKSYRQTIESNYKTMLDNLASELKRKQAELNPFQQFAKDANLRLLEEKGKRFAVNPYSAVGGYLTPLGQQAELTKYETNINRIKYADELKKIENEKLETQKKIKQELQAQEKIDIQRLQSENEWKDTTDFHIRLEALKSEYKAKEVIAMEELNKQEEERKKWAKNILLDNSLTLTYLDKQLQKTREINKAREEWYLKKQGFDAEDMKIKSKFANENPDITAYGFNAMGFGETDRSIAMKMGKAQQKVYQDLLQSSRFSGMSRYMQTYQTDTAFNFGIDEAKMKELGLSDEAKERLREDAKTMTSIFTDAANAIKEAVGSAAGFWKDMAAQMFSAVANFAGNAAWNMITGEDVSGVQALREARKTDLKDQQEQLKNKAITQETYAKRAYEIEKTYIENKKAAEKNYRNEQWKQLGAVFWAQGLGYVIKGGIDMFIPGMQPTAKAELVGGAALMGLGAMLGYGRGGKTSMSKANLADESKATRQQDINVYVDNKIFEDKRQLRKSLNEANY
jgi:hypothetical protein